MRAAWWWIDRWQKSTAYKEMRLAEQGAYRNLLDELWLRDGVLPNDERILARLCGDPLDWAEVRNVVMARFYLTDEGWRNTTHDEVMARSQYQAEKQKRYRKRRGNVTRNVTRNDDGNVAVSPSPSPSPSPSQEQTPNGNNNGLVRRKRRTSKGYTAEFETFWRAYSSRRREGKGRAFKAWQKDRNDLPPAKDDPKTVTAAAAAWAAHWDRIGKETSYIPHPSTWLADRRWEDDIPINNFKRRTDGQKRLDDNLDAIRQAMEDEDAYEARVHGADGGTVRGCGEGEAHAGEGPDLLALPFRGVDGRADDPSR